MGIPQDLPDPINSDPQDYNGLIFLSFPILCTTEKPVPEAESP